jgi:hypothetical protein
VTGCHEADTIVDACSTVASGTVRCIELDGWTQSRRSLQLYRSSRVIVPNNPDEVIPLSFKEWRAGIDPVLERAPALTKTDRRN